MRFILGVVGLFMGKPTKCPNCGNGYFHWDRHERGGDIWKCNKCGWEIKD